MMPETYIFRLERPAQVVNDKAIPRKFVTCRLDCHDAKELSKAFGEFLMSCGYPPAVVRESMRAAVGDAPNGLPRSITATPSRVV